MSEREFRGDLQRPRIARDRLFVPAESEQAVAEVVERADVIGADPERGVVT